ncbi:MAG TPA: hypothetical protein H9830_07485 [Candidatus Agrococcus pullicola]|uniref:Uncharacterized protein n=1 Tax=Candidatus Agrococcus pullicola TaxID=2838429 RepID=A0A9D1YVI7_9MICO|nr:hypothetical protein [Candidatus Agrococcus pullicola]
MRKYLLNIGVLSALAGAVGVAKATQDAPKDWRTYLLWASWGIGVALAVGAVVQQDREVRLEELERELSK